MKAGNGAVQAGSVEGDRVDESLHQQSDRVGKWPAVATGEVVVCVDGAWHPQKGRAAVGVVVRDALGSFVAGMCRGVGFGRSALEIEAHAIHVGMKMAIEGGFKQVSIRTDSAILAREMNLLARHGQSSSFVSEVGQIVDACAHLFCAGPRIDDKHSRWLHLRIRPSTFPFTDAPKFAAKGKPKTTALVDGRWTLAFRDEDSCKTAHSMIVEEMDLQRHEVERILEPVLDLALDFSKHSQTSQVVTPSRRTLSS